MMRARSANTLPGVEENVESFALDIDTSVPGDQTCIVRDGERCSRCCAIVGMPCRDVEGIKDLPDLGAGKTVVRDDALNLGCWRNNQAGGCAESERPERFLDRAELSVAALKRG